MLRIKYSFQSGIVDWWQKYFKWHLTFKSEREYEELSKVANETKIDHSNSQAGVYVLCLIQGFGLLISLVMFVCYDCDALRATMFCIKTVTLAPLICNKNVTLTSIDVIGSNRTKTLLQNEFNTTRITVKTCLH